jgi:hypothetical protein
MSIRFSVIRSRPPLFQMIKASQRGHNMPGFDKALSTLTLFTSHEHWILRKEPQ